MLNKRRSKIAIVAVMIFSMVAMYGAVPVAKADSMDSVKVTLSTSAPSVAASTTIAFDLGTALTAGQYVLVTYNAGFTNIASAGVFCPAGMTASTTLQTATTIACEGALASTSVATLDVGPVTNPGSDNPAGYDITVSTHQADGTEIESSMAMVYIIAPVTVTATVNATLAFDIVGLDNGTVDVNGTTTNATSTATTIEFGTLTSNVAKIVGQQLEVSTNADAGFTVTVQQASPFANGAGGDIDTFNNGTSPVYDPVAWVPPIGTLAATETGWGHFGLSSEDATLDAAIWGGADDFGSQLFTGLTVGTPLQVMYHNGPADGTTANEGMTQVAYAVEVSALQEAGDYTTSLIYICTPTY